MRYYVRFLQRCSHLTRVTTRSRPTAPSRGNQPTTLSRIEKLTLYEYSSAHMLIIRYFWVSHNENRCFQHFIQLEMFCYLYLNEIVCMNKITIELLNIYRFLDFIKFINLFFKFSLLYLGELLF